MSKLLLSLFLLAAGFSARAQDYTIKCSVNGREVKNRAYLKPKDTFTLTIQSKNPKEVWVFRQIALKCAGSSKVKKSGGGVQESVTKTTVKTIPEGRYRNKAQFSMRGDEFCPGANGTVSVKAIGVQGQEGKVVNLALYDYLLVPTQ